MGGWSCVCVFIYLVVCVFWYVCMRVLLSDTFRRRKEKDGRGREERVQRNRPTSADSAMTCVWKEGGRAKERHR